MIKQMNENLAKEISPKIYALLIEGKGSMFLSVQYAYTLEDAFSMAQNEFLQQAPANSLVMQGATIKLFAIKALNQMVLQEQKPKEIIPEVSEPKVIVITKEEGGALSKNDLMKLIIEKKDVKLLKSSKGILTESEFKFLKNKLLDK